MPIVIAASIGTLFGIGLIVSGMADPSRVIAFLDLAGLWNPSLALVMAGAIAAAMPVFTWMKRRPVALLGESMRLPTARHIDRRLVMGSLLFGVGWGLAGICPGPALVLVGAGIAKGFAFALSMVAGMAIFEIADRRRHN